MNTQLEADYTDSVICGYNREWIKANYAEARKAPEKYLLATMNINNFRYFNCLYGYTGGNEILNLIYHKVTDFLTEANQLVMILVTILLFFLHILIFMIFCIYVCQN